GGGVRLSACVRQGVGGGATTQLGAGAFQQLSELLPVFGGAPVGVVRGPVQVAGRRHRVGQRGGRPAIVVPPQERGDQVPQRVQIDRCRPGRCLRGAAQVLHCPLQPRRVGVGVVQEGGAPGLQQQPARQVRI